ncbi:MAG: IS110 family transposase [Deltaproteobacteria bacterium]|nr:IS110 family transposase [Deltaproteobacteria bacterium]
MDKGNKLDFGGQHIYVGMDVHKKSWSVSIYTEQFEHKTFTQPPEVGKLTNYLQRTFPGATYHAVYEAGFSGFWLHDHFREQGIDCMVVNPADVPTKDKERAGKTDRVDCRKLARSLRNGDMKGIYVPPRVKVEDRTLVRTRQSMVRKQTRCKNQITSILFFYGINIPEESRWSRRFIHWLESIHMERASGDVALKAHLEELKHLRQIIANLNRAILSLSKTEEYRADVLLLKSVPGISTLTAMILLTELADISRFPSLDKLASYTGLIPDIKSSGETEYSTGITFRRNAALRSLLIESSWVAVRKDPALMMAFNKLSLRMKKTQAIVHIARKLLNRIRFVLKNRQKYVPAVI